MATKKYGGNNFVRETHNTIALNTRVCEQTDLFIIQLNAVWHLYIVPYMALNNIDSTS